jgi:hypothetical protein
VLGLYYLPAVEKVEVSGPAAVDGEGEGCSGEIVGDVVCAEVIRLDF